MTLQNRLTGGHVQQYCVRQVCFLDQDPMHMICISAACDSHEYSRQSGASRPQCGQAVIKLPCMSARYREASRNATICARPRYRHAVGSAGVSTMPVLQGRVC